METSSVASPLEDSAADSKATLFLARDRKVKSLRTEEATRVTTSEMAEDSARELVHAFKG